METQMFKINDSAQAAKYFEAKLAFTTGPMEVRKAIDASELFTLIDVRSERDFRKSHIRGAINLPQGTWDRATGLSTDRVNILYCYSEDCHLAAKAAYHFAKQGYPVMELQGGFRAWEEQKLPVVSVGRGATDLRAAQKSA